MKNIFKFLIGLIIFGVATECFATPKKVNEVTHTFGYTDSVILASPDGDVLQIGKYKSVNSPMGTAASATALISTKSNVVAILVTSVSAGGYVTFSDGSLTTDYKFEVAAGTANDTKIIERVFGFMFNKEVVVTKSSSLIDLTIIYD